jgi:hypothetical protein
MSIILSVTPFLALFSVTRNFLLYIDPGTGSIILQALAAAVAGIAIAVKLYWHRLLKFFGIRKDEPESVSAEEEQNG